MKNSSFPLGKSRTALNRSANKAGKGQISLSEAQALAVSALAYIAADEVRLGRFLSLTGLNPSNLRGIASRPEFLGAVLEHLLSDETLLLAFCANGQHDPLTLIRACRYFSGAPPGESM